MYIHLPWFDWVPVIAGPILAAALLVAAMVKASKGTRLDANQRAAVIIGFAVFIATWFAAYAYLAGRGVFSFTASPVPLLPVALLLPLIVAFVAFRTIPAVRAIANEIPQERLIGIQIIRLMGFAFLMLLAQSQLPAVFALPAGVGDMLVGLEAIFVAPMYARRADNASRAALFFNLFGIADFVVALTIGFLAASTNFQLIHVNPTTDLIVYLPLVMVPTFGVPLFTMMHALSLNRIAGERKAAGSKNGDRFRSEERRAEIVFEQA